MDIRGYETGPIKADAAFTADFAVPDDLPMQSLVDMVEIERHSMDVRPGMRHKYVPLRFDPATGARQVGGRYLFDTWDNAVGKHVHQRGAGVRVRREVLVPTVLPRCRPPHLAGRWRLRLHAFVRALCQSL